MKKPLLIALLGLAPLSVFSQARVGYGSYTVLSSTPGVSKQFSTTNLWVRSCTVYGKSSVKTGATPETLNVGNVFIGPVTNAQPTKVALPTGGIAGEVLIGDDVTQFNLKDWYFNVDSANDGITLVYH